MSSLVAASLLAYEIAAIATDPIPLSVQSLSRSANWLQSTAIDDAHVVYYFN